MNKNKNAINRVDELFLIIIRSKKPKTRIRKIISYQNEDKSRYFYVVTISKNEKLFTERVDEFNNLLLDNLKPNESLVYNNDCFCIMSDKYEISYTFEGYYKQANKKGYIINGIANEKLLHRMGFEFAIKYARKHNIYDLAISEIDNTVWQEKYPNSADRLIAIIKHEAGK